MASLSHEDAARLVPVFELLGAGSCHEPKLQLALDRLCGAFHCSAAAIYEVRGDEYLELCVAAGAERSALLNRANLNGEGVLASAVRDQRASQTVEGQGGAAHPALALPARVTLEAGGVQDFALYLRAETEHFSAETIGALQRAALPLCEAAFVCRRFREGKGNEARLAALYHDSPVWYHSFDLDGTITEINQVALDLLGRRREEVIGRRLHEFCTPDSVRHLPALGGAVEVLRDGEKSGPFEVEIQPAQGPAITMRLYNRPVYDSRRVLTGGRTVLLNVTHERELQRQLIEAQKMQAVGTLTAGIAHDFNNLLTTVLGQVELLRLRHGRILPEDANDRLARVEKAARRAAGLVSQLLTFSRHDPQQMGSVDVWAAVLATVELLKHGLPENIEIRRDAKVANAIVWGSLGQLQQALVNMATNSMTAMPQGGTLTISLDAAQAPQAAGGQDAPAWVVLSVSDTGYGMTEAVRQRVFEPFFTTKPSTDSAGLGLAIVYGIVQSHRGHVEVESTPGTGTTFRLYFPLQNTNGAARSLSPLAPQGNECILLVEDDQAVAETTAQMLASLGYRVMTALRPSDALRIVSSGRHQFDLMITDITMPEMTGYQLADRIQQEFGPMRVLFVTGYDFNSTAGSTSRFLMQKPLSLQALGEGVRQALASHLE